MTGPFRTASGGRIDRSRPLASPSTARRIPGFQGDTLASALLANGVHLMGRSFKYHRPRGVLGAGAEEPNALVTVTAAAAARRRTCAPRRLSSTKVSSRRARTAGLRFARCRRVNDLAAGRRPRRGLLLQDLHASSRCMEKPVRARHSPRGGPWRARRANQTPITTPTATPFATYSSSAPVHPAWLPRSPLRKAAHGSSSATNSRRWAAGCSTSPASPSTDERARMGSRYGRQARRNAERHAPAAHAGLRLLRTELPRACSTSYRPPALACCRRATRENVEGSCQAGRARDRSHRASARLSGQRPAWDHARFGRTHVSQSTWRKARLRRRALHGRGLRIRGSGRSCEGRRDGFGHCRYASRPGWPRHRSSPYSGHPGHASHRDNRHARSPARIGCYARETRCGWLGLVVGIGRL